MNTPVIGTPGVKTTRTATPRKVMNSDQGLSLHPGGEVIDGSLSRDTGNTGDLDVLRAGLLMGKITSSGKYAPAILGNLGAAYDATADTTSMTVTAATAVELARRIGTSGTFKLTGPPTASGTVQTVTVTYSAVNTTTGVLTITSLAADVDEVQTITPTVGANADEVHTITFDAAITAGQLNITYFAPDDTPIPVSVAWDTNIATTIAAWNVASVAAATAQQGGASNGAVLTGDATTLTLTYSGVGFTNTPIPQVAEADVGATTGPVGASTVLTTAGSGVIGGGTYRISATDSNGDTKITGEIAHDANAAAINTALDDAFGASQIVATGGPISGPTAVVLTFSGSNYDATAQTMVEVDVSDLRGCDDVTVTETTAAVTAGGNDFINASLVQPTDGSETIKCLINDGYGIKVTDEDSTNQDVGFPNMVIGGNVDASQIISYGSDSSIKAWIKAALRTPGGSWTFDDDF